MSFKAKLYISSIIAAAGITLLVAGLADPRLPELGRFLQLLVLATVASTFKIRLPGMQSSISLNFVLFIIGIAGLTLLETLLMAITATTVQTLWRARTRPKLIQVLFNVATLVISLGAGFLLTGQLRNGRGHVPGLVVAGVIFFISNTWLVSLVLSFVKGGSALSIWRTCHCWAFPYYVAGAVVAVMVSACAEVCGWGQALAILPSVYLLYGYYDTLLKRKQNNSNLTTVSELV